MKPEALKAKIKNIEWFTYDNVNQIPASQGYLMLELMKHYKIPAKQLGYNMDIVAIKTKKQIIVWKDTGIGARFLGLLNFDGSVEQHKDDNPKTKCKLFASRKGLWEEAEKKKFDGIKGFKAHVTEKQYYDALEVLPPFKMIENGFIQSEAISDQLYMQYKKEGNKFFCEIVQLEDEVIEECNKNF